MALHKRFHKVYSVSSPYFDLPELKAVYGTPEHSHLRRAMMESRIRFAGWRTRKQQQAIRGKSRRLFRGIIVHQDCDLYRPFIGADEIAYLVPIVSGTSRGKRAEVLCVDCYNKQGVAAVEIGRYQGAICKACGRILIKQEREEARALVQARIPDELVNNAEYSAWIEHIHTPRASEY